MSQDSLNAVWRANRALKRGDVDAALELFDPEVVYHEQPGTPLDTAPVLRGLDDIRTSITAYLREFADFHSEIDELVEVGDKVVCMQRWRGTGRESGAPVEFAEVLVYTFRQGRVVEGTVYPDRATALEAVGLP
jgi:ketosteroid isomerase-like protein